MGHAEGHNVSLVYFFSPLVSAASLASALAKWSSIELCKKTNENNIKMYRFTMDIKELICDMLVYF